MTRNPPPNKILSDTCRIGGCAKPRKAIGQGRRSSLCDGHEYRKRVHGDVLYEPSPPNTSDTCCVEGCERARQRNGVGGRSSLCPAHQARKNKYGELFAEVPIGGPGERRTPLPVLAEHIRNTAN